ncbi:conserved membrane protein of unknown function [Petrocella atlantisensis]|uniref:Uncharacterized protein n=1 Tax=Petrocella atlantisensis TaxID=2173034 RepID=A0A3P7PGG0_9FIRM|nr:hypothetical protein [Petrocella atlantisensis]VDN49123.1 conserved membrane protein of unknown function [Petrocella atlantisensis]
MSQESEVVDRKKLILGLSISLCAFILNLNLPYTDRSLSQMIIPPIKFENITIYLSGLIAIALVIYGANLIVESGRYKNKIVVALVILLIGGPLMMNVFDFMISPIYLLNDGVKTLKISESDMQLYSDSGVITLEFSGEFRSYREIDDNVKIYLRLPDVLEGMIIESESLVFESNEIYPRKQWKFDSKTTLELADEYTLEDFYDSEYYNENYTLILVDENQTLEIVIYGLF